MERVLEARRSCAGGLPRLVFVAAVCLAAPSCNIGENLREAFTDPCGGPCPTPPPQDCASLSSQSWTIGPFPTSRENELAVAVNESREVFLFPFVEDHCRSAIASVAWSTNDASVATVTGREPSYRGSWVTGVSPGQGALVARLTFTGGLVRASEPRAFVVSPQVPSGGTLVAEGVLELAARNSEHIPFSLPQDAARLDILVDWDSVLNSVDFILSRGTCSGPSICPGLQFVDSPTIDDYKPLRYGIPNVPAGSYTLRIDNLGPRDDTVRYDVRFTAK